MEGMGMNLEELLATVKAVNPAIKFLIEERYHGHPSRVATYWAHADTTAFCGDTMEELIKDVKENSHVSL
jgi:hypothetical protein